MKIILLLIPYVISLAQGCLLIRLILKDEMRTHYLFRFSLAFGLGLGVSAYVGYLNFMLLGEFNRTFQIAFNLFIAGLCLLGVLLSRNKGIDGTQKFDSQNLRRDGLYFFLLTILFVPVYYLASFYPYGGWDAWAVWHFKAKFLFLAGDTWRTIFDPQLWRSSPHYPLLLPFINAWVWVFQKEPLFYGPMFTSLVFTFLTLSLLISSLGLVGKDKLAALGSIVLVSSPFFTKTAISQYADVVLGYYLLAALACLTLAHLKDKKRYAFLGGNFLGFLSFTKPEGLIAALILIGLTLISGYLNNKKHLKQFLLSFLIGSLITLTPSLLFTIFIAPENVTSVNGFLSKTDPSTWARLRTILVYVAVEVCSLKWSGVWLLIIALLLVNLKRAMDKTLRLLPSFLALYLLAVITYYWMNTHFEILWWLSVSASRILASILPVALWWVIYSLKVKAND